MGVLMFLNNLGDEINDKLCDTYGGNNYQGVYSSFDMEAEAATALSFFPRVLSQKGGCFRECPIHCLFYMYCTY